MSEVKEKGRARLENWRVVEMWGERYLVGNVYNHPDAGKPDEAWRGIHDGNEISTSSIVCMDESSRLAETQNTIYELGTKLEMPKVEMGVIGV